MTEESTGDEIAVESAEATEATPAEGANEEAEAEIDPYSEVEDLDEKPDDGDAEEVEGDAEGEEEGEEEAPETVELNFGGNALEIPANATAKEVAEATQKFADGVWSDYTRKSQANAEQAKSLAEREVSLEKLSGLNGEILQNYSHGKHLQSEIAQLSQYNVQELWQSDPDQARRISDTIASKQAELQNIISTVGQQESAFEEAKQSEIARRAAEGKAILDRTIKGFSTEKAPEVVKYAVEKGMAQADAEQWALNPRVTEMAYKAMMYDRMQAGAKKPASKPKLVKPVTPMKTKGAASSPSKDLDKMSDAEFAKMIGLG